MAEETTRDERGYHKKFRVIRTETGEEVEERTFTLIPSKDPAARIALAAYARASREIYDNEDLDDDLNGWLGDIDDT